MELDRSALDNGICFQDAANGSGSERRRWVTHPEMRDQLLAMFAANRILLPVDAFDQIESRTMFRTWLDCCHGRGLQTRFGQLPVVVVGILERAGYDPMQTMPVSDQVVLALQERWEHLPDGGPSFPEADVPLSA